MKCRNCKHWERLAGSKSRNTDYGNCTFIKNNKIVKIFEDKMPIDVSKEKLVVFTQSEVLIDIEGISISTISSKHIKRFNFCQTAGNFFCAFFETNN